MEALWISEMWVVWELEGGGVLSLFPCPCQASHALLFCATSDRKLGNALEMRPRGQTYFHKKGKSCKSGSGAQN